MFLRITQRKNKDGSVTQYYQLAHNTRHPQSKKPVAQIIHNFGRVDQLDRYTLVRLCQSIARVCGLQVIDRQELTKDIGIEWPDEVKMINTVELGCVLVIEALWEGLGIGKVFRTILKSKGMSAPYERALLAMTANRLCEPESKLGVWDRWLSKVYLSSCSGLSLDNLYEAMDFFHEHHEEVEREVFFHTANLFNLEVDLIFYDTTTASFSIDEEDEDQENGEEGMRKFGRAKNGVWSPQVVVALAVTREGLPVRCWVFPGNTSDIATVEKVRQDLRGWKLGRALFVGDSGMNSEDNRKELSRACGKYLLATRMGSVSEVKNDVLAKRGRYRVIQDNLEVKEVVIGDGERRRRYILCYNPHEAKRQRSHRKEVVGILEKELKSHADKKATAQWAIELLASMRYKRYLRITKEGEVKINRQAIAEAKRYDGKWVLQTNDDTISLEDAACGYKGLMVIEQCFRTLKSTRIKMSPMYHWLSHRIEAHVRICVLALLVQRVAELACGKPWPQIRQVMLGLQASEFRTKKFKFFRRNEVPSGVENELKKLEIAVPKGVLGITPLDCQ